MCTFRDIGVLCWFSHTADLLSLPCLLLVSMLNCTTCPTVPHVQLCHKLNSATALRLKLTQQLLLLLLQQHTWDFSAQLARLQLRVLLQNTHLGLFQPSWHSWCYCCGQHYKIPYVDSFQPTCNSCCFWCCRNTPGTISAQLAQDLGLMHKEITLVMTDVQASSKLWEW